MKRKVLYVERDPYRYRDKIPQLLDYFEYMKRLLSEQYDVDTKFDLSREIILTIKEERDSGRPYEALVTHVPYKGAATSFDLAEALRQKYGYSLDVLTEIKTENPELLIVAYTGTLASDSERVPVLESVFVENGPIDSVVLKSENTRIDFEKIKDVIENSLGDL